eukprot:TRINITY_DN10261_c0_g1_i1.p1 TRINITY_DN10261_c0_g1~~TRINITY_DN10261_c0_g1_i1.p1  ORF type:complete len:776 (-),score=150.79 TRINITY_DN10261_c0_g1_i1:72-2399(-)
MLYHVAIERRTSEVGGIRRIMFAAVASRARATRCYGARLLRNATNRAEQTHLSAPRPSMRAQFRDFLAMRDVNGAFHTFQRLLRVNATDASDLYSLARLCPRKVSTDQAKVLQTAMSRLPTKLTLVAAGALITTYRLTGQPEHALGIEAQMREDQIAHSAHTARQMVLVCAELGQLEEARERLMALKSLGLEPTAAVCLGVFGQFVYANRVADALQLLEVTFVQLGVASSELFLSCLDVLVRHNQPDTALQLFRTAKRLKHTAAEYTTMIRALCGVGRMTDALALLNEMPQRGLAPTDHTYAALAYGCQRIGDETATLELWRQARDGKIRLEAVAFTALISALSKNNLLCEALAAYELMIAQNITPLPSTFDPLLHALSRQSEPGTTGVAADMVLTRNQTLADSPLARSEVLLKLMFARDDLSAAFELLRSLEEQHMCNVCMYTVAVEALARRGRVHETFEMLERMRKSNFSPTDITVAAVINGFVKSANLAAAQDYLRQQPPASVNVEAYTSLMQGYLDASDVQQALQLLDTMMQQGKQPTEQTFGIVLNGLLKNRRLAEAKQMRARMREFGVQAGSHTFHILLTGFIIANDEQAVLDVLQEMKQNHITLLPGVRVSLCGLLQRVVNPLPLTVALTQVRPSHQHMKSPTAPLNTVRALEDRGHSEAACLLRAMFEREGTRLSAPPAPAPTATPKAAPAATQIAQPIEPLSPPSSRGERVVVPISAVATGAAAIAAVMPQHRAARSVLTMFDAGSLSAAAMSMSRAAMDARLTLS